MGENRASKKFAFGTAIKKIEKFDVPGKFQMRRNNF